MAKVKVKRATGTKKMGEDPKKKKVVLSKRVFKDKADKDLQKKLDGADTPFQNALRDAEAKGLKEFNWKGERKAARTTGTIRQPDGKAPKVKRATGYKKMGSKPTVGTIKVKPKAGGGKKVVVKKKVRPNEGRGKITNDPYKTIDKMRKKKAKGKG